MSVVNMPIPATKLIGVVPMITLSVHLKNPINENQLKMNIATS